MHTFKIYCHTFHLQATQLIDMPVVVIKVNRCCSTKNFQQNDSKNLEKKHRGIEICYFKTYSLHTCTRGGRAVTGALIRRVYIFYIHTPPINALVITMGRGGALANKKPSIKSII